MNNQNINFKKYSLPKYNSQSLLKLRYCTYYYSREELPASLNNMADRLFCERLLYTNQNSGMANAFAFKICKQNEAFSIKEIFKLESTNPASEKENRKNDGFATKESLSNNEDIEALNKTPLERSLRKYFITEDFPSFGTQNDRNAQKDGKFKQGLIDFMAGSLAGIAQIYTSQPFDTVKVKQQTFPKLYSSMFRCFVHTYRKDGIVRGLYAGSLPAAVASVAENSVLFTAYGGCQEVVAFILEQKRVEELSAFGNGCAGFLAAFFSSFTMCPTELIKCKLQAVHEMKHYVDKHSKVTPISTIKLAKHIFENEGIPGFYRGLSSTLLREMPGYFFFFGSYEATREFFAQPHQAKEEIGPLKTMCAGAVGGLASWTFTYPVDVIKTRVQINNLKGSMLSVGSDILRKEGVMAFYSGLLPTVLRTIPATATLFLVYEYSKKLLTDKM